MFLLRSRFRFLTKGWQTRLLALAVALGAGFYLSPDPVAEAAEYGGAPTGGTLSSSFGWRVDPFSGQQRFHGGIDIAADAGSPVHVVQDGEVLFSDYHGGYGNVILVRHRDNTSTLYGHNKTLFVRPGAHVRRGQVIALVGSTGRSTGPHLHFEVHQNNQYVDPLHYLSYLHKAYEGRVASAEVRQPSFNLVEAAPPVPAKARRAVGGAGYRVELVQGNNTKIYEF